MIIFSYSPNLLRTSKFRLFSVFKGLGFVPCAVGKIRSPLFSYREPSALVETEFAGARSQFLCQEFKAKQRVAEPRS